MKVFIIGASGYIGGSVAFTLIKKGYHVTGLVRSLERAKQIESPLTPPEHEAFQSVVGSLMWICRSCRPSIAYRVSELQTATRKPIVEDLQKANKVII